MAAISTSSTKHDGVDPGHIFLLHSFHTCARALSGKGQHACAPVLAGLAEGPQGQTWAPPAAAAAARPALPQG